MSYLIASNRVTGDPARKTLRQTLERFLHYQMPTALFLNPQGTGFPAEVPLWMLIYETEFGDASKPPFEVVKQVFRYVLTSDGDP
jgi:hypothetical protein